MKLWCCTTTISCHHKAIHVTYKQHIVTNSMFIDAVNQMEYIYALQNVNGNLSYLDKERLQESRVWGHKLWQNVLFAHSGLLEQKVSSFGFTNSSLTVRQNKFFALGLKVILALFVTRVCLIIIIRFPQKEQMQT